MMGACAVQGLAWGQTDRARSTSSQVRVTCDVCYLTAPRSNLGDSAGFRLSSQSVWLSLSPAPPLFSVSPRGESPPPHPPRTVTVTRQLVTHRKVLAFLIDHI